MKKHNFNETVVDMKQATAVNLNKYKVKTDKGVGGLLVEAGLLAPGRFVQTERTSVQRQRRWPLRGLLLGLLSVG